MMKNVAHFVLGSGLLLTLSGCFALPDKPAARAQSPKKTSAPSEAGDETALSDAAPAAASGATPAPAPAPAPSSQTPPGPSVAVVPKPDAASTSKPTPAPVPEPGAIPDPMPKTPPPSPVPAPVLTFPASQSPFAVPDEAQKAPTLPGPIQENLAWRVRQGICQKEWSEMAQDLGVIHQKMDADTELWMVPCARWAYNQGWSVYVTIQEPSHPDGFLTKALHFVNYSIYEGVLAQDLIYNIQWEPEPQTVSSQYYWNGQDICGYKSQYKWENSYQSLLLKKFLKQDDCRSADKPWVPVLKDGGT